MNPFQFQLAGIQLFNAFVNSSVNEPESAFRVWIVSDKQRIQTVTTAQERGPITPGTWPDAALVR